MLISIFNKKQFILNTIIVLWFTSIVNIAVVNLYLSTIIAICFSIIIYSVDYVKNKVLKERFHYEDLFLYSQVFRFPMFYIPFVGFKKFVCITIIVFSLVFTVIYLDIIFIQKTSILKWISSNIVTAFIVSYMTFYIVRSLEQSEIDNFIHKFGLLTTIVSYMLNSTYKTISSPTLRVKTQPEKIIVIQSESFMDVDTNLNRHKDLIKGKLEVPCYGAYTMRSEFAFLTGINLSKKFLNVCNPFRKIYKHVDDSYINQLKKQGYYCIALHPFNKRFFNRKDVFEKLGFDEFINEPYLDRKDIFVTDKELTETVKKTLEKFVNKKVFVFVVTIAAHGPYTLKRNDPMLLKPKYQNSEIDCYLDLNYKATIMLNDIYKTLNDNDLMIWYGDHKPSISSWKESQENMFRTDYIISSKGVNHHKIYSKNIHIENLLQYSLDNCNIRT